MKNTTQMNEVLKYMKSHKRGITSWVAFERFGITRLADIIYKLKKLEYDIESEQITKKNRYGHVCNFSRYYLV